MKWPLVCVTPRTLRLASLIVLSTADPARAAPGVCGPDPAQWPLPQRTVFVAFDTSGSMVGCTDLTKQSATNLKACVPGATVNSCGLESNRINDGKCALRKILQSFPQVRFALASFPSDSTCVGCAAACGPYHVDGKDDLETAGPDGRCTLRTSASGIGCPPLGSPAVKILAGLPLSSGQNDLLTPFLDDVCQPGDPQELMPVGATPLAGMLRDLQGYILAHQDALDPPCQAVDVILISDGTESCQSSGAPSEAAGDLFQGNPGGRSIRVFAIGLGELSAMEQGVLQQIADNGQCAPGDQACREQVSALFASNETELIASLATILLSSGPEDTCDGLDNDCNGCIDEGNVCGGASGDGGGAGAAGAPDGTAGASGKPGETGGGAAGFASGGGCGETAGGAGAGGDGGALMSAGSPGASGVSGSAGEAAAGTSGGTPGGAAGQAGEAGKGGTTDAGAGGSPAGAGGSTAGAGGSAGAPSGGQGGSEHTASGGLGGLNVSGSSGQGASAPGGASGHPAAGQASGLAGSSHASGPQVEGLDGTSPSGCACGVAAVSPRLSTAWLGLGLGAWGARRRRGRREVAVSGR